MHDSSVIELLWTSCGKPELIEAIDEEEVAIKVRTWLGELSVLPSEQRERLSALLSGMQSLEVAL